MKSYTNDVFKVTYPEDIFETRGSFAYIRLELLSPKENIDVSLKLIGGSDWTFTRSITLTRKTNAVGVVVFPIGQVCESLIRGTDANSINYVITASEVSYVGAALYAVPGFSDREIFPGWGDGENIPQFYPAASCIVVYPNAGFEQSLFFPKLTSELFVLTPSSTTTEEYIGYSKFSPVIPFDPTKIPPEDLGKPLAVGATPTDYNAEIKTYYDYCAKGIFLKWTDAAGVPYLYRWTLESQTDEMSVGSTYQQLDDTLTLRDVQTKTLAKRYTLHSRIVERDIFNLCRTILGCQDLFMYDPKAGNWVRFVVEDSESEDAGTPMQDLVIEIVRYEYL